MKTAGAWIRQAVLLLVAAAGMESMALTLGDMTGSATVGRPLDLTSAIRLDDEADPCLNAEVMYGEVAVPASQLRVSLHPGGDGETAVRVRSALPVNEPVVTVVLKAGCARPSLRRYTLLVNAPAPAGDGAPSPAVAANRIERPPVPTPLSRTAGARTPAPAMSRLTLGAASAAGHRPGFLRASTELLSVPTDDPAERATAAAVWRVLRIGPQDIAQEAGRLQQLESGLVQARALAGSGNGLALARTGAPQVQQAIQRPDPDPTFTPSPVQAGFAVALMLMIGGVAARAMRRRALTTRWADSGLASEDPPDTRSHADAARLATAPALPPDSIAPAGEPVPPLAPAGSPPYAPLFSSSSPWRSGALQQDTMARLDAPQFPNLARHTQLPAERVEALELALQESGFFLSLGQHDAAAGPLIAYIDADTQAAPLAYLELLRLYKLLDNQENYELWSDAFFCSFSVDVPPMEELLGSEAHDSPGAALELHPATLALVTSAWSMQHAGAVIEELLLGSPHGSDLMSVQAYNELLWLLSIHEEIAAGLGSSQLPAGPAGLSGGNGIDFNLDEHPACALP